MTADETDLASDDAILIGYDEATLVDTIADDFCAADERQPAGSILLTSIAGRRCWLMGDQYGYAILEATAPTGTANWVIPRRVMRVAACARSDVQLSHVDVAAATHIRVVSDAGVIDVPLTHEPELRLVELASQGVEVAASTTVRVRDLAALVASARMSPYRVNDDDAPLFWIMLDDDRLTISIDWSPLGVARYSTRGEGAGRAVAAVNPSQLTVALTMFDEDITVGLTPDSDGPIVLRGVDRRAVLMPIRTTYERLRPTVEGVLCEAFGPLVLHRDADGDYQIRTTGHPDLCTSGR